MRRAADPAGPARFLYASGAGEPLSHGSEAETPIMTGIRLHLYFLEWFGFMQPRSHFLAALVISGLLCSCEEPKSTSQSKKSQGAPMAKDNVKNPDPDFKY